MLNVKQAYRITFFTGRTQRNGEAVTLNQSEDAEVVLAKAFGGFTSYDGRGAWYNHEAPAGQQVQYEPSRTFVVLTEVDLDNQPRLTIDGMQAHAGTVASLLSLALNQYEVWSLVEPIPAWQVAMNPTAE